MAGWIAGFDKYGSGPSARAFYLSCWNGGCYLKDRVGQGTRDELAEIRVDNLEHNPVGLNRKAYEGDSQRLADGRVSWR